MKKILFFISVLPFSIITNAQPYSISFSGTGASMTISTVKVDNLTAGTTLTINGDDILLLSSVTGINPIEDRRPSGMKIYPNPMTDNSVLQIYPPVAGMAEIAIFDMTGKMAAQIKSNLDNSIEEFNLSGIKNGLYLISVNARDYHFSGKLLSTSNVSGTISFEKITNNQIVDEKTSTLDFKGINSTVNMQYTSGDRLMFTGISGIYTTIITDIPSSDKTISFNFIACTDGDNNNYPVVKIGTQWWMAENMKYLPSVVGPATLSISVPYYYIYGYDGTNVTDAKVTTNYETYGVLYNWPAAMAGSASSSANPSSVKGVCPTGWHLPSDAEWTQLTDYLEGADVAGGKLKETGTTHWASPNTVATNETGFTGLPGGVQSDKTFTYIGTCGFYWSTTESNYPSAWYRLLSDNVQRNEAYWDFGLSVRCLKD